MFNTMRNQYREKTGKDLPKFAPQKGNLARSSRQGSESSLSSLVLESSQPASLNSTSPSPTPDLHQIKLTDGKVLTPKEVNIISKKEDEWRARLEKKDSEWTKKYEKRETELLKELTEKETEWMSKEHTLTEDLLKQTNELKEALRLAEEYKRKVIQYQEDKDQVESFQTQEMAKIKHLLLAKEKENSEISASLKENTSLVEALKSEVSRLRPLEEKITNLEDEMETLRHTSEKERQSLSRKLTESEEEVRHLTDRVAVLTKRSSDTDLALDSTPDNRIQALLGERTLLERRLEEAHIHLTDIKASWSAQISSLETQVGRLSRQAGEEGVERRRALEKVQELEQKLEIEQTEKKETVASLVTMTARAQSLAEEVDQLKIQMNSLKMEKDQSNDSLSKLEEEIRSNLKNISNMESEIKVWEDRTLLAEENFLLEKKKLENLDLEMAQLNSAQAELVLRNAQLSQDADMARKEVSELKVEVDSALTKVTHLEKMIHEKDQEINNYKIEMTELSNLTSKLQADISVKEETDDKIKILSTTVSDLEAQLAERNKTIRVLQQNLNDMKKTLQRELKQSSGSGNEGDGNHVLKGPATLIVQTAQHPSQSQSTFKMENDVNFQYLRHVIIKFLTSREYEAQQLTKAVATLLHLTPEEELLIKDTLDWKMSWFGSRPKLQDYS